MKNKLPDSVSILKDSELLLSKIFLNSVFSNLGLSHIKVLKLHVENLN